MANHDDRWARAAMYTLLLRCVTGVALTLEANAETLRQAQRAAVHMRWARETTRVMLGHSMALQAIEYEAGALALRRWCRARM